jgi:hypothetical protein
MRKNVLQRNAFSRFLPNSVHELNFPFAEKISVSFHFTFYGSVSLSPEIGFCLIQVCSVSPCAVLWMFLTSIRFRITNCNMYGMRSEIRKGGEHRPKIAVLWDVMPCGFVDRYWRFGKSADDPTEKAVLGYLSSRFSKHTPRLVRLLFAPVCVELIRATRLPDQGVQPVGLSQTVDWDRVSRTVPSHTLILYVFSIQTELVPVSLYCMPHLL